MKFTLGFCLLFVAMLLNGAANTVSVFCFIAFLVMVCHE